MDLSADAADVVHFGAQEPYYRARYYDYSTGRFLTEDPLRFRADSDFYRYVHNNPARFVDPSGLIHQAWDEPPFDGRLHDDPGAGLEVLCTKGRNRQRDILWLQHSIFVRSLEIMALGKEADAGHSGRLGAEIVTWKRCKGECDKKPDPTTDSGWDEFNEWLHDRWRELDHYMSTPHCWWCIVPVPGSKPATEQ